MTPDATSGVVSGLYGAGRHAAAYSRPRYLLRFAIRHCSDTLQLFSRGLW